MAGTTTKEADGAVAEESGESSRLGGVFQEAVTPAVGLPDTAQDAQLKLNFRSTYYRWGDLLPRDLFLYPRSLTSITVNSSVL